MKKILIIGMSLNVGGAEKSLINLLNLMNKEEYNVDLMLFQPQGLFLKQIPDWINLIEEPTVTILYQSMGEVLKNFSFNKFKLSFKRCIFTIYERFRWRQFDKIKLHRWLDFYQFLIPQNSIEYDVGIAYAGGETAYYLIDKTNCSRKVYLFHSDYSKIDIDINSEEIYVRAADQIITISETCKTSLQKLFPKQSEKICVLHNLSSSLLINKLSKEFYPLEYKAVDNYDYIIISVGRLINIKGYDIAIKAAKRLKDTHISFVWFVVGEGKERKNLERAIKKYNLERNFILLGIRENPYPYINNADILVQSSRFEGKSVVLDEAKILKKTIVATNYNSVEDQIVNEITGIVAEMTPEGLEAKIKLILNDKEMQRKIENNLASLENSINIQVNRYFKTLIGE